MPIQCAHVANAGCIAFTITEFLPQPGCVKPPNPPLYFKIRARLQTDRLAILRRVRIRTDVSTAVQRDEEIPSSIKRNCMIANCKTINDRFWCGRGYQSVAVQ